jgi:hypothetical protein
MDAGVVQIITTIVTTIGTVITVIITSRQNKTVTRESAKETHQKIETAIKRVSGEFSPLHETPLSVDVVRDSPAPDAGRGS